MGVSIHDPEWDQMKVDFEEKIRTYIAVPGIPDVYYENLVDSLFSIMNDYGAVSYT